MLDIGESLRDALGKAGGQLAAAQTAVARANAGAEGHSASAAMAQTAQAALFTEALLSALRARFAEIKAVAK